MHPFQAFFAGISLVLIVSACDESTGPGTGDLASLAIGAADSVVALGSALELNAVARDEDGRPVDVEVVWSSTDPSTALVSDGIVTGLAIGYVDAIARAGDLADTLRVRVHDPDVPLYTMRVRFGRGQDAEMHDLSGLLRFDDVLAGGPGDQAGMGGYAITGPRDTSLTVIFPDGNHSGRFALTPFPLDLSAAQGPIALLRFGSAATDDLEYYASVDTGWVHLDVEEPPAPGWRMGVARGFAYLPLVKLAPVPGAPPVLTGDTLWLHVDFDLSDQHVIRGHVIVTMLDGPLTGTSVLSNAFGSEDDHGGWMLGWDADFDGLGSGPGRWEMSQELRILAPAVGTTQFPRFTGGQFDDPALWPSRFTSIFFRDDPRFALVSIGTLTIARWLPPTLEDYGEIHGVADAHFEIWTPDLSAPTGDTIRAIAEFAVPIGPEAGLPGAPPIQPHVLSFQ